MQKAEAQVEMLGADALRRQYKVGAHDEGTDARTGTQCKDMGQAHSNQKIQ